MGKIELKKRGTVLVYADDTNILGDNIQKKAHTI
jgi:hypothetical protein